MTDVNEYDGQSGGWAWWLAGGLMVSYAAQLLFSPANITEIKKTYLGEVKQAIVANKVGPEFGASSQRVIVGGQEIAILPPAFEADNFGRALPVTQADQVKQVDDKLSAVIAQRTELPDVSIKTLTSDGVTQKLVKSPTLVQKVRIAMAQFGKHFVPSAQLDKKPVEEQQNYPARYQKPSSPEERGVKTTLQLYAELSRR